MAEEPEKSGKLLFCILQTMNQTALPSLLFAIEIITILIGKVFVVDNTIRL